MASVEIEMPWPPSINGYWRTFRNRQIISKRGREYRKKAVEHIKEIGLFNKKISGAVQVTMVLNPPTLRKYDVDNFNKALFDALSHAGFWLDDEQVNHLQIVKGEKVKGGSVPMFIEWEDI